MKPRGNVCRSEVGPLGQMTSSLSTSRAPGFLETSLCWALCFLSSVSLFSNQVRAKSLPLPLLALWSQTPFFRLGCHQSFSLNSEGLGKTGVGENKGMIPQKQRKSKGASPLGEEVTPTKLPNHCHFLSKNSTNLGPGDCSFRDNRETSAASKHSYAEYALWL